MSKRNKRRAGPRCIVPGLGTVPKELSYGLPWTPFEEEAMTRERQEFADRAMANTTAGALQPTRVYRNSRYQVLRRDFIHPRHGPVTHLSIKRHDQEAVHDWRDLQRIKNELCGAKAEGLEVYPAESRLVDTSNQYHLWVLAGGRSLDIGYGDGRLVADGSLNGSRQRPFEERPGDCIELTPGALLRRAQEMTAARVATRDSLAGVEAGRAAAGKGRPARAAGRNNRVALAGAPAV